MFEAELRRECPVCAARDGESCSGVLGAILDDHPWVHIERAQDWRHANGANP